MAQYHINPSTGEPGKCSAKKACPFGSVSHHYDSASKARLAYEAAQEITASYEAGLIVSSSSIAKLLEAKDLTHQSIAEREPGIYEVAPGEYVMVDSETRVASGSDDPDQISIDAFLTAPASLNEAYGILEAGTLNGLACYSDSEAWSGVTQYFMDKNLYFELESMGVAFEDPEHIVLAEPARISKMEDNPQSDGYLRPRIPGTVGLLDLSPDFDADELLNG